MEIEDSIDDVYIHNRRIILNSIVDRYDYNLTKEIIKDYIIDISLTNGYFIINNVDVNLDKRLIGNYTDLKFRLKSYNIHDDGLDIMVSDMLIYLTEFKYINSDSPNHTFYLKYEKHYKVKQYLKNTSVYDNFEYKLTEKAKRLLPNYFTDKYYERQKIENDKKLAESNNNVSKSVKKITMVIATISGLGLFIGVLNLFADPIPIDFNINVLGIIFISLLFFGNIIFGAIALNKYMENKSL